MLNNFKRYTLSSILMNIVIFVLLIFLNIFFDIKLYNFSIQKLFIYLIFTVSLAFSIILINKINQLLNLSSSFSLIFSFIFVLFHYFCLFSEYKIYLTLIIVSLILYIQIQLMRKDNIYLYLFLGIIVGLSIMLYNYMILLSISILISLIIINNNLNKSLIIYITSIFIVLLFCYEINILIFNKYKIPPLYFPQKEFFINIPSIFFVFIVFFFIISYFNLMSKYNRLDNEKRIFTIFVNLQIISFAPIMFNSFQNSLILLSIPFSFLLGIFFISNSERKSYIKLFLFILFQILFLLYVLYTFFYKKSL